MKRTTGVKTRPAAPTIEFADVWTEKTTRGMLLVGPPSTARRSRLVVEIATPGDCDDYDWKIALSRDAYDRTVDAHFSLGFEEVDGFLALLTELVARARADGVLPAVTTS